MCLSNQFCNKMDGEGKKISFSFSKSLKKSNITKKPQEKPNGVQLIDCVEDKTIKVVGAEEKSSEPLVIPVRESRSIIDRIKVAQEKRKQEPSVLDERPDSELTSDELAARELLKDSQNYEASKKQKILTLPQNTEEKLVIEGKEEASLEDYESVPISEYGMAMLRGMGWKEGMSIGRNQKRPAKVNEPPLRPKGMGLGANKIVNKEKDSNDRKDEDEEELMIKKGTFGKITAGHYKGNYCEVQGLDDEAGRVIVKTSDGVNLSLNEFLITPVTKSEYEKMMRTLNGR